MKGLRQTRLSSHQRVDGVLEIRLQHNQVVLNRQQIALESAARTPSAASARAFPLEVKIAVRLRVPSAIPLSCKAREPQHERAVIVEDELRLLRVVADGIRQFTIVEEGARGPRQRRKVCRWGRSRRGRSRGLTRSSWRRRLRTPAGGGKHQEYDDCATANTGVHGARHYQWPLEMTR